MNYNATVHGEQRETKYEKDDSFWFSDKLEDWYGLKPKIRTSVIKADKRKPKTPTERIQVKKDYYSSMEAANYCGVSAPTFLKEFRALGLEPDGCGSKKYSYEQVKKLDEVCAKIREPKTIKSIKYGFEEISKYTGYSIEQIKATAKKEVYTYGGMKALQYSLNRKYKQKL